MNQRELGDLRANVQLEFARFTSEPFQAELRRRHSEQALAKRILKEELPPMPADFNEANALAWLSEVEVECPEYWARYQDQKRRERDKQKFGPRKAISQLLQLLLAFVSALGTLNLSERILRGLVVRLVGVETAEQYHWILNPCFYGPLAITPLLSAFGKCSRLRDHRLAKIPIERMNYFFQENFRRVLKLLYHQIRGNKHGN